MSNPTFVDQVFEFNHTILGLDGTVLNTLEPIQREWLEKFVLEELTEFRDAADAQDLIGMVDAIIDLVYGALGTLRKMGLTVEQAHQCISAVHAANMTKRRGNKGRGSDEDAVKPAGFVAPEEVIGAILFGGRS